MNTDVLVHEMNFIGYKWTEKWPWTQVDWVPLTNLFIVDFLCCFGILFHTNQVHIKEKNDSGRYCNIPYWPTQQEVILLTQSANQNQFCGWLKVVVYIYLKTNLFKDIHCGSLTNIVDIKRK